MEGELHLAGSEFGVLGLLLFLLQLVAHHLLEGLSIIELFCDEYQPLVLGRDAFLLGNEALKAHDAHLGILDQHLDRLAAARLHKDPHGRFFFSALRRFAEWGGAGWR